MTSIRQDIIYGLRTLISQPAFTGIAILSLALGIAVNSVMFSIINATILAHVGLHGQKPNVQVIRNPGLAATQQVRLVGPAMDRVRLL